MTGLRIGEILALRSKRINLIGETLVVAETCFMGHFGTPKTRASRREVPLSPAVVEALARSLWEQKSWVPSREAILLILCCWKLIPSKAFVTRRPFGACQRRVDV
jgi:integrase